MIFTLDSTIQHILLYWCFLASCYTLVTSPCTQVNKNSTNIESELLIQLSNTRHRPRADNLYLTFFFQKNLFATRHLGRCLALTRRFHSLPRRSTENYLGDRMLSMNGKRSSTICLFVETRYRCYKHGYKLNRIKSGLLCLCASQLKKILPPLQIIISRFDFYKYIDIAIHLSIPTISG
jgi:hypothetical protein